MAMTLAQKTEMYRFFAIAFDAAPGIVYMDQLDAAIAGGMTTKQIVNVFTAKPLFSALYPNFLDNASFATSLVNNVVGASASAAAKAQAVADIVGALNIAGTTRGDVIYTVFNNLAAKPVTDATWGGTSQQFANQVAVAQYYTETLLGSATDTATLQAVISNVTSTSDVSTPAAIQAILGAQTNGVFTLTTGIDGVSGGTNFTGGSGNDIFNAVDAVAVGTWTALDKIDGGAGTNIFNVSHTGDIAVPTGATVANIQTANFAATGNIVVDTTTALTAFTGLTSLTAVGNGTQTLTVAATTDVNATDTAQAASLISITGGKNVALTTTATDGGTAVLLGNIAVGTAAHPVAGTVNITATNTDSFAGSAPSNITVVGGTAVTVGSTVNAGVTLAANAGAQTANTAGLISVGTTAAPATGAVSVTAETHITSASQIASGVVGEKIAIIGGTTVTVNETASVVATATGTATSVTLGDVSVTGGAATTAVTVNQAALATGKAAVTSAIAAVTGTVGVAKMTASPGVTGVAAVTAANKVSAAAVAAATLTVVNGAVAIADKSIASSTVANTITAVTLANYGNSTIGSQVLSTLTLSGEGGTLGLTAGGSAATVAAHKTLTLNLDAATLGLISDNTATKQFSTVNTVLASDSTLAGIAGTALRTLAISGTGILDLTAVNTALTSVTVAGAAGFTGDLSSNIGITSFTGANTTAANTVTLNAATQSFTGGAGDDTVTVAANAAVAITGGAGANTLVMAASVSPSAAGMKAFVSGFQTLSTPSTSGTIDMSKMPVDITALQSTGASGGVTFSNVADGTSLALTAAHVGGTTTYTLAGTGASSKSVTVTLGASTSDTVDFGTVALADINGNGLGTVSLVSNGLNITKGDAIANNNTVALTDAGITQLNVSGTQSLVLSAYTGTVTTLTINNTNTGTYGVAGAATSPMSLQTSLIESALDTLTFTGSGSTNISSINNGSVANLSITNSGTGTANIGQIWTSTSGSADTALTSLTLTGAVTTGTKTIPLDLKTTGVLTVSGAADNAGVALNFYANNSNAVTVTLGNGNNALSFSDTSGTTTYSGGGTVTTGSGADYVYTKFATSSVTKAWTISTGAGDDAIYGGTGTSIALHNTYIGGDGADYIQTGTGAISYSGTSATDGLYAFVAFAGSATTGTAITTVMASGAGWSGTLYAESQDTITSTGINAAFSEVMTGAQMLVATGAGKIFAGANIISNYYAEGAIAVASTAKDVFFFQTNANAAKEGLMHIENFKIGQDIIALTDYLDPSMDRMPVGNAAAVTAINAVTPGEVTLASANWTWALDVGSTTAGTLHYTSPYTGLTANNLSIHLVGVQGTIVDVNSFFYQA